MVPYTPPVKCVFMVRMNTADKIIEKNKSYAAFSLQNSDFQSLKLSFILSSHLFHLRIRELQKRCMGFSTRYQDKSAAIRVSSILITKFPIYPKILSYFI